MTSVDELVVPRSRVASTHASMRREILAALEPLIFESPLEGSAVRRRFEEAFAAELEQPFACGVHSGTIGLYLALRGCGVSPGDEVITVGNSDISTTAAISHCGATSVLCDVLERDYTMDPDLVVPLITKHTKALLPVDLYGHPTDVRRLREIADEHGLKVVEDAALATGARDHGRPVGVFAHASVYSFAPFKPLGSTGNGAVITSTDATVAERIAVLAGYGHGPHDDGGIPGHQAHVDEGFNVPLDPMQAALLAVKLPFLKAWTRRRSETADAYRRLLADLPVHVPLFRPESEPTFRSFTILVENQQEVYVGLKRAGVEAVLHYTPPVYRQPVYPNGLRGSDRLPITVRLAQQLVCLPVTPELTDEDTAYVAETLRAIVAGAGTA